MLCLPCLCALLALDASAYAPNLTPPDGAAHPPASAVEHRVSCDDPLESAADCHLKARALCKGDFKIVKLIETERPPAAGLAPPFEESRGEMRRELVFTCKPVS